MVMGLAKKDTQSAGKQNVNRKEESEHPPVWIGAHSSSAKEWSQVGWVDWLFRRRQP